MANTAFNPSDKSASVTLSGSNLVATGTGALGSVRALENQVSGKFYWELTFTTVVNSSTGVGVANAAYPLANSIGAGSGNGVGSAGVNQGGTYVVEGSVKSSLGAFSNGSVCCIALDLTNKLIWFRNGAAGNWNASSSNNPATGVGGAPVTGWGGGTLEAYPCVSLAQSGDVITANFGDSTFVGAVPSGFTAGWPSTGGLPTSLQVTQVAVEHFYNASSTAQVTIAALEHFYSSAAPAQVTQIALEEWGSGAVGQVTIAALEHFYTATPAAQITQVALEEWGSLAFTTLVAGVGEADAAAIVAGAGAIVTALPIGIGEVDAGATVTGAGAILTLPIGAGEVDAGATVTGAGATVIEPLGAGRVDAAATVTGAGAVIPVAAGAGEADAAAIVAGAGFLAAVGTGEVDAFADVRGMGVVLRPPNSLPFFPGQGWSVHRRPTFDTIVAPHPSGSEVRLALWQNALWEFELSYDALASNDAYPGVWTNTLQTLMGFYLARGGARGSFLFIDPDFNSMAGQGIGAGDGTTVAFAFVRTFGGQIEPVGWVTNVTAIYLDGVATPAGWTVSGNTITFAAAPASGVVVSADFTYGFVCRFLEDTLDFEQFMDNLWLMKSLKFRQVRL